MSVYLNTTGGAPQGSSHVDHANEQRGSSEKRSNPVSDSSQDPQARVHQAVIEGEALPQDGESLDVGSRLEKVAARASTILLQQADALEQQAEKLHSEYTRVAASVSELVGRYNAMTDHLSDMEDITAIIEGIPDPEPSFDRMRDNLLRLLRQLEQRKTADASESVQNQ